MTEGDPGYRGGMSSTRVLILGGDGYLGWPTALHLSARGHEVALVDDFSRRRWHLEQSTDSLTPIRSLDERVDAWEEISGHRLQTHVGDICDADFLDGVVASFRPEAIFLHKLSDLATLEALSTCGAPVVRMVHDHDLYCLRG